MSGKQIGLKWLDLFLPEAFQQRRRAQLYRGRIMAAALLFTILPAPLLITENSWIPAGLLLLSGLFFLYRLKRRGAYQYAAFLQSLVLLMTSFWAALVQRAPYTGAYHWIPWMIVFVSVMDGPRLGAGLGVLAILASLLLLNVNSNYGSDLGVFSSFQDLLLHLTIPAFLVLSGILGVAMTFAFINEQVENDTQQQHILRAQNTHKAAIGQLVGQLAHEVNNPLAIVHAAALQMLIMIRRQQLTATERQRLLGVMESALTRLGVVIDGLKAFAGGEDQQALERSSLLDILDWVRNQIESFARCHGVQLIWKGDYARTHVLCQPEQIAFIISTLVHEAIGSALLENDRRVWIQVIRLPGHRIDVQIRDRGPWSAQRGTGPGLSALRKLAQDHAGSLHFHRWHGENVFRLILPLSNPRFGEG
jgi:nitrogen-specific signal transduction histidine kinase